MVVAAIAGSNWSPDTRCNTSPRLGRCRAAAMVGGGGGAQERERGLQAQGGRERGEISQKVIFFLIFNRYNSSIFIVPNGLDSQVTTGNIIIDWIFLS
jgi:hypothetical protein